METRVGTVILLFVVFTVCTSCGLLLFKHGWPSFQEAVQTGRWWSRETFVVALGAGLYAASFLVWLFIASRIPLTVAYPIAIGLSLVAITVGAVVWLGEPLSAFRLAGSTLIVIGIALIVR